MKKERNLGIDLLRIFCMHMIILHHVLDYCGITLGVEMFSMNYTMVCLLHSANHCAVNGYALISGYVHVDLDYKLSSIIKMWLQVLFYTVGILIIFVILRPEMVNRKIVLESLFPMLTEHYWYFTQYFCMFFFIPILNLILNTWNTRQFKKFLLTIFILFSCVNVIVYTNLFNIDDGFSAIWLAFMYLIGGYIKKNPEQIRWNKKKALLAYAACILLTTASRWVIQFTTLKILGQANDGGRLMVYTSPTMLLGAVALLIIFSELKVKRLEKVIRFLAPLTFSVYIIHHNVLLRKGYPVLSGLLKPFLKANPIILLGVIFLTVESIYLVCSMIDFGRVKLFQFLQVGRLSDRAGSKLSNLINKILKI